MKVYDIQTNYSFDNIHSVVADSMAEAERIFKAKYWPTEIKSITVHSDFVQVQGFDEQPKNN